MRRLSLKYIILTLYALLIACMGLATIVEKVRGKDFVHESFYGSWWFIALWMMLTILSLVFLFKKKVHKRLAVFLVHLSFVVMLSGAMLTHLTSESGTMHLRIGENVATYVDADSRIKPLPFAMKLTDFEVITYPGTDAVMDYRCDIEVKGKGETADMTVSMNDIGKAEGYRFYQSAYDSDGKGTRLLVAHDPYGIAVTYLGYVMLLISLLWTMFSKHTRIRSLYRIATKQMVLLAMLCMCSAGVYAGTKGEAERAITPVSKEIAHEFGKVVVLYNGRLCPVNTAALEFVTKLSGKPSWNGYSADEIFLAWMLYYTEWEGQKIIRIKSEEVQQMLGIDGQWASVNDFYAKDNTYKLTGKANDTHLSDAVRKAVREADEKILVVTMFYNSEMLRMFPLASAMAEAGHERSAKSMKWYTPGSTELPLGTPNAEFQFINHAMDHFVKSVLADDVNGALQMIAKIKLYQKEKTGDVLPSAAKVEIEVLYNALQSARWVVFACLALSIVFCLLLLAGRMGKVLGALNLVYIGIQTAYLTVLLGLRWIVSGHVPMSNGYETMLFMAWVTLVMTIFIMRKIPVMKAFGPLVASFCLLVAMLAVGSPQITRLMPVLQSPLLSSHVAMIMVSYALLTIITLIAIQCLVLARKGDNEELTRMTALSQLMLYPAITTLTIGIFIGAVWANVSWGTYWSWDPKETWALITLMIYAIPLHKSFAPVSQVRYHLYVLMSFLAVLMTYFGVNYFMSGMHSYAQ